LLLSWLSSGYYKILLLAPASAEASRGQWAGENTVKIIVCIPARYSSTRFPGKVLAKDTGKFLIQHTWERAKLAKLPANVLIAADDKRILDAAESFDAARVLTNPDCKCGTDRIAEAVADLDYDIVINVQADEPEIDPAHIDLLAQMLIDNPNCPMATLAAPFENPDQITDPNIVKVVVTSIEHRVSSNEARRAIYFSRLPIPYDRQQGGIGQKELYLRHLGIYAYRKDFLLKLTKLPQTPLEKTESLEQLRAIENGFEILVAKVERTADGIDTPAQYADFVKRYKKTTEKRK